MRFKQAFRFPRIYTTVTINTIFIALKSPQTLSKTGLRKLEYLDYSLLPIPYSPFSIPHFLFPIPHSLVKSLKIKLHLIKNNNNVLANVV